MYCRMPGGVGVSSRNHPDRQGQPCQETYVFGAGVRLPAWRGSFHWKPHFSGMRQCIYVQTLALPGMQQYVAVFWISENSVS